METGLIKFLSGVDEHGAKPPAQFQHRFAVLTWIDRDGDGTDPWCLFRKCIPVIANKIGADCVLAEFWKTEKRWFCKPKATKVVESAWNELMKLNSVEPHEKTRFPDRLRFERQGQTVLLAKTDWWSSVGGPQPYHDSVTISFFSTEDLSNDFGKIFTDAAHELKYKVGQI